MSVMGSSASRRLRATIVHVRFAPKATIQGKVRNDAMGQIQIQVTVRPAPWQPSPRCLLTAGA